MLEIIGFGFAHVIDCPFHCDDTLDIVMVYVVDTAHGDLRVCVLHDSLDRGAALSDYPADQVVVRENVQGDLDAVNTQVYSFTSGPFNRNVVMTN